MYAIDTNIFVYAHNVSSPLIQKAKSFLEHIVADINGTEKTAIVIPLQVWAEFVNVCTRQNIGKPLSIPEAIKVVRKYTELLRIPVIYPKSTQLQTFLTLLETTTTRKKVFDVALAATLKDNNVAGLYTVNVDDFKSFPFLQVENPLA
jgi:predicted nucleic acid-binding protein